MLQRCLRREVSEVVWKEVWEWMLIVQSGVCVGRSGECMQRENSAWAAWSLTLATAGLLGNTNNTQGEYLTARY